MTELAETAVAARGVEFIPVGRPAGFRKMKDRACFRNALHLVVNRPGLRYCEGFALQGGDWIHHAWVADEAGNAIDVTWAKPGERYLGVTFTVREAATAMRTHLGLGGPVFQPPASAFGWRPPGPIAEGNEP